MASSTRRTAGCGPACPVVWQGRVGDHSPYADCFDLASHFESDFTQPQLWRSSVYNSRVA